MSVKLFVGGLSWDTTDESLQTAFTAIGQVATATVIKDKYTGKSRGFGFVEMTTEEDAQKAIQEMNGKQLDGRTIVVNEARPQEPRDNNRGGGRSFGGGGFNRDHRRGGRDDRGGRNW